MDNFTVEQSAVLALLQNVVGARPSNFDFSLLNHDNWLKVEKECRDQSIALMCFDEASKFRENMSAQLYGNWFKWSAALLSNNLRIMKVQSWLVRMLEGQGIGYTILKGFSSACYYPDPEKRISGDIDFLIQESDIEKTEKLLIEAGCQKDDRHNDNHLAFQKNGVWLELHHCVAGIPEEDCGKAFDRYLEKIIESSESDEVYGIHKPAAPQHGVVILLHTLHHVLSSGIGLRHICDWACFVGKTHKEAFWQDELLPLFKQTGLLKFAFIVTDASVRYFGIEQPEWLSELPQELAQEFIVEIFKGGNFGRKNEQMLGTDMMLTKNSEKQTFGGKLFAMIRALNNTNLQQYPILDKAPWLYPFIMVWRMLRYLVLMLMGKRQSFAKVSRYADERGAQFEKFKLYKTDEE